MLAQARLLSKVETRSPEDVQSIVARACAGDEAAFHAIFNRYSKPVLSFIYHLLTDRRRAEELLKEKSYEEISKITGSSVGKLKTDLHRARIEMKRKLQPYLGATGQ